MKNMLVAVATLMAGTAALAQTAVPAPLAPPAPMEDRVTTRDEVVAKVREHFGRMDADKNGSITTEEAMQGRMQLGDKVRAFHMRRGEGAAGERDVLIHRAPMGDPNAAFDRLDANKDGSISRDEFAKAREERFERRVEILKDRKEVKKHREDAGAREFRMHRMGGMGGARMIVMADTDKDGKITQAEAEAMALQHFDQMDANRDGQVTPEERRASRPIMFKKIIEDRKTQL